jgi:hypothetical protein
MADQYSRTRPRRRIDGVTFALVDVSLVDGRQRRHLQLGGSGGPRERPARDEVARQGRHAHTASNHPPSGLYRGVNGSGSPMPAPTLAAKGRP